MPLILDGIEIPVDIDVNEQELARGKKALAELGQARIDIEKKVDAAKLAAAGQEAVRIQEVAAAQKKSIADYLIDEKRKQEGVKRFNSILAEQRAQEHAAAQERLSAIDAEKRAREKATQDAAIQHDKLRTAAMRSREEYERISQIGRGIMMIGLAALTPMILSAKKFIDSAKEGDAVAQQWKHSMAEIESSAMRVGRVIANELNPSLAQMSELSKQAADFSEKNPGIANSALSSAGGMAAIGAVILGAAQIGKFTETIKGLTMTGGVLAEGTAMAAGATVIIGGIVEDVLLNIGTVISNSITGQNFSAGDAIKNWGMLGPLGVAALGEKLGIDRQPLMDLVAKVGSIEDKIIDFIPGLKVKDLRSIDPSIVDTQRHYLDALETEKLIKDQIARDSAENDLAAARQDMAGKQAKIWEAQQDAQIKLGDLAEKYAKQRSDIETSLQAENIKAYQDYQRNRIDAERQTITTISKIEYDAKQKEIQDAKKHAQTVYDLTAARDALGLVKENARYKDEQTTAKEATRHEIEMQRSELKTKLSDLRQSYDTELRQRKQAADAKLKLLNQEQAAETKMLIQQQQNIYNALVAAFQAALVRVNTLAGVYKNQPSPLTGSQVHANAQGGAWRIPDAYGYEGYRMPGGQTASAGEVITVTPRHEAAAYLSRRAQGGVSAAGGSIAININLGSGGTISQVRQMIATTRHEILREVGRAIEAA